MASDARSGPGWRLAGVAGVVLALLGLSALGDTPDPHDDVASMAAYFVRHRNDIFLSTALVALAGVAIPSRARSR